MILDGALLFDSASNITAATATQASANVIDLLNARDMGIGDNPSLKILCQVTTALVGGTSLAVKFQTSTDNTTWDDTAVNSGAVVTASLTAGQRLLEADVPRPGPGKSIPRYLRLLYTTVGTFTPGSVTAAIVLDRQDSPAYPAGINISN